MPTQWWLIQEPRVDLLQITGLVKTESLFWPGILSWSIVSFSWNLNFHKPIFNCSNWFLRFEILQCWKWHRRQNWERIDFENIKAKPIWQNIGEAGFQEKWSRHLVWVQRLRDEPSRWRLSAGDWYPSRDTGQEYGWPNRWMPRARQTDFELRVQTSR